MIWPTMMVPILAGIILEVPGMRAASLAGIGATVFLHHGALNGDATTPQGLNAGHLAKSVAGILLITLAAVAMTDDASGFGRWLTIHQTQ